MSISSILEGLYGKVSMNNPLGDILRGLEKGNNVVVHDYRLEKFGNDTFYMVYMDSDGKKESKVFGKSKYTIGDVIKLIDKNKGKYSIER
jgi:hypothetical protein